MASRRSFLGALLTGLAGALVGAACPGPTVKYGGPPPPPPPDAGPVTTKYGGPFIVEPPAPDPAPPETEPAMKYGGPPPPPMVTKYGGPSRQ